MKRWTTALAALSVVTSACTGLVLDPVRDGNGGDSANGTSTTGSGTEAGPSALAMRYGDVTPAIFGAVGSFTTVGPAPDPDSLLLFFTNQTQSCGEPGGPVLDFTSMACDGSHARWQAVLLVPPALDRKGTVDLGDYRTQEFAAEVVEGGCGGGDGYGAAMGGTLEILHSDVATVTLRLSNGVRAMNVPIDGVYVATRCGAPPPPAAPAPAAAFKGTSFPPPPGGPPADPLALYVVAGNVAETCADPWSTIDCKNAWRLSFSLPASLQQPGTIDLSDPAIAATLFTAGAPSDPSCGTQSHPLSEGSLTIVSLDAGGVTFSLTGSRSYQYGTQLDADGLYAASFCP